MQQLHALRPNKVARSDLLLAMPCLRHLQRIVRFAGRARGGGASEEVPLFDTDGVILISFRPTVNYRRSVSNP